MGNRKKRREQFFQKHPNCCFCGGMEFATTEDHQPARTFFRNRAWPEGFVFPACEACNETTKRSEQVMSLLANGNSENVDRQAYQALIRSLKSEYPDIVRQMLPNSSNEIRGILRQGGLQKPHGIAYGELPLVKLNRDFWDFHIEQFSRKLLIAFHYMCFGKPLSETGGAFAWFHTNFDWAAGRFPNEILELAERVAVPSRQKAFLGDQFGVRWNSLDEPRSAVFVAHIHASMIISGITTECPTDFKSSKSERLLRPWKW